MNRTLAIVAAILLSTAASADERLPVILASASPAFDVACIDYYAAGNNPNVGSTEYGIPEILCTCLADHYRDHGLGVDALEFFARTYRGPHDVHPRVSRGRRLDGAILHCRDDVHERVRTPHPNDSDVAPAVAERRQITTKSAAVSSGLLVSVASWIAPPAALPLTS